MLWLRPASCAIHSLVPRLPPTPQVRTFNRIDLDALEYRPLKGSKLVAPAEDLSGIWYEQEVLDKEIEEKEKEEKEKKEKEDEERKQTEEKQKEDEDEKELAAAAQTA